MLRIRPMTTVRALLLFVVILALAACGGAASASPSADVSPSAAASTEPSVSPSVEPSEAASPSAEPSPSAAASASAEGEGLPATFWIDPSELPLDPTATSFKAITRELTCASGQSPNGRLATPTIRFTPTDVTIIVRIIPLPGSQDCQGNPDFGITVTLSEPVGTRTILDGSADPPRDATTLPS
jgi:hypothetical protein